MSLAMKVMYDKKKSVYQCRIYLYNMIAQRPKYTMCGSLTFTEDEWFEVPKLFHTAEFEELDDDK